MGARGADEGAEPPTTNKTEGRFGWESLGGAHIPYVLRKGEPYCAARSLGSAVRFKVRPEVFECAVVGGAGATQQEAQLLDTVNIHHCDGALGSKPFLRGEALLRLKDARALLSFLQRTHARLDGRPGPCGLVKLGSLIVPYATVDQDKLAPIRFLREIDGFPERRFLAEERYLEGWPLSYARFCCKVAGLDVKTLSDDKYSAAVIQDVQKLMGIEFDEYWPETPSSIFESECKTEETTNEASMDSTSYEPENLSEEPRVSSSSDFVDSSSNNAIDTTEVSQVLSTSDDAVEPSEKHVKPTDEETLSEKEEEIKKNKSSAKKRRINETEEEREKRLERLRLKRLKRLETETEEQREKRLLKLRLKQSERLANETEEQREQRLLKLRLYQSQRLANETEEQRKKRLLQLRHNQSLRLKRLKDQMMNNTV